MTVGESIVRLPHVASGEARSFYEITSNYVVGRTRIPDRIVCGHAGDRLVWKLALVVRTNLVTLVRL